MVKKNYVWVVTAVSESTDHYGPYVFAEKPSDKKLKAFFREEIPSEFAEAAGEEGPGNWNSFLHVKGPKKVEIL